MQTLFSIKTKTEHIYPVKDTYLFCDFIFYLVEIKKGKYQIWHEHGLNVCGNLTVKKDAIRELTVFVEATIILQVKIDRYGLNQKFSKAEKLCPLIKI